MNKYIWLPQAGTQTAFITCPIKDILFGGARGGGKTSALIGRAITRSVQYGKYYRGVLFRRTYDELDEIKRQTSEVLEGTGAEFKVGKNTWYFPWGGWLKLRYLQRDQDATRYQGHQYNDLMIDEMGNFPSPDPIDKLQATLRDENRVPCMFAASANPGGLGHFWIKNRYMDNQKPCIPFIDPVTKTQRVYIPSLLVDNQKLIEADPEYIQRLKNVGAPWLVRAWLLGDWNATQESKIIKLEWFKRYSVLPSENVIMYIQSWDTGVKASELNDPSVCTTWAITREHLFLVDVYRARLLFPDLKMKVQELARAYNPNAIIIEDKASGQSLIQELNATTMLPIIPSTPVHDKQTRMLAETAIIEAGRVFLPIKAHWLQSYESELSLFPNTNHDDQVDSTSQMLAYYRKRIEQSGLVYQSIKRRVSSQTNDFL